MFRNICVTKSVCVCSGISVSQMTTCNHFPVLSPFVIYDRDCSYSNTTGATSGVGTTYPSGAPELTHGVQWGSCSSIFSFLCSACLSLCHFDTVLSFCRFTDSDYPFDIFYLFLLQELFLLTTVISHKYIMIT